LDATIFFDFRTVYGNEGFTDKLRKTITQQVQTSNTHAI